MKWLTKPTDPRTTAKERICNNCGVTFWEKDCDAKNKKRLFCSQKCYSLFVSFKLPKGEANRYGKGFCVEEKAKRSKARRYWTHYLRDKNVEKQPCVICGETAEGHHPDYNYPLLIVWLCLHHHGKIHGIGDEVFTNGTALDYAITYPELDLRKRGSNSPVSKLTETDVRIIRETDTQFKKSKAKIATYFKIHVTLVYLIVNRKIWTHI